MTQYREGDPSISELVAANRGSTFDALYDAYTEGEFGDRGPAAWATMVNTYSKRAGIPLQAGATALTGIYDNPTYRGEIAKSVEATDAEARTGLEERLVVDLLGSLDRYNAGELEMR